MFVCKFVSTSYVYMSTDYGRPALMSVAFLAARHCAFYCYNNHLSCLCSQLTNKLIGLIGSVEFLHLTASVNFF